MKIKRLKSRFLSANQYIVINDDADKAADEVISIIESEHLRVDRVLNDYYNFIGLKK